MPALPNSGYLILGDANPPNPDHFVNNSINYENGDIIQIPGMSIRYSRHNPLSLYQCRVCHGYTHRTERPSDFYLDDMHMSCALQRMKWEQHHNYPPSFEYPSIGIFTDNNEIQAEGTGKKVSADDLDTLFKDIDDLTEEEEV